MKLLTVVCGLSAGIACASLTEQETQFLDTIESKIQSYVVFSTHWASNFMDTRNNESYAKHTNRFKESFLSFEQDVLHPLQTEKRAADQSDYGQAIKLTHDIVDTLYKQAKDVYLTLEKHRKNPSVAMLGLDLAKSEKYTAPAVISGLQSQLRRLQTIFNRIHQSLAAKIGIIIDSLEQRKNKKKPNAIEGYNALKHRLNCKN